METIFTLTEFNEDYEIIFQTSSTDREKLIKLMSEHFNVFKRKIIFKYGLERDKELGELNVFSNEAIIECGEDTRFWRITENNII